MIFHSSLLLVSVLENDSFGLIWSAVPVSLFTSGKHTAPFNPEINFISVNLDIKFFLTDMTQNLETLLKQSISKTVNSITYQALGTVFQ